jgi:hypothetical protein
MQIEGQTTPVATLALHLLAFAVPIRTRRVELGADDSPVRHKTTVLNIIVLIKLLYLFAQSEARFIRKKKAEVPKW